eukprot:CAMPEP_0171106024 /NCGR_PEP_ID=MMETSP0766_2-20121228/63889_1 /TAXON_ID=439317 /ORGANISM="Gambierdiscus australes, Strain CAWD 149" /LENGTH=257 /DNA_ID=CAMNT_0011567011 /DNA_START=20 /DNA_END=793 /DNA_ORIENTATION=+
MRWLLLCGQAALALALHPSSLDQSLVQLEDGSEKGQVEATLRRALWQLGGTGSSRSEVEAHLHRALEQLDSAGLANSEISATLQRALAQLTAKSRQKDKIALMILEMCPFTWFFGIDRFYLGCFRTAFAKLGVGLGCCLLGLAVWCCLFSGMNLLALCVSFFAAFGAVWGVIDYFAVVVNALRFSVDMHTLGMHAEFDHSHVQVAFVLGIVNLLFIPAYGFLLRSFWLWRKQSRMARLRANAMKSPLFQKKTPAHGG